jgi:hypothetical protein
MTDKSNWLAKTLNINQQQKYPDLQYFLNFIVMKTDVCGNRN